MDHQLLVTVLRWLLDLCRQWARRSLHCLLRLYSAFSPRRRTSPKVRGDNDENAGSLQKYRSTGLKDSASPSETHRPVSEQPVVIACSSTPTSTSPRPRKPPPARTYTRYTSAGSYNIGPTCVSPTSTINEIPISGSTTSTNSPSPPSYSFDNQRSLTREPSSLMGNFTAVPAQIIAPPEKPIKSFLPSQTARYDRNVAIQCDVGPWTFEPLETLTVYDDPDIPLWRHYVQPEGQLYFRNVSRKFHYITEAYLCDPGTLAEIDLFISIFERKVEDYHGKIPSNVEVVLEINEEHWGYYMVDMDRRRLFWLDDCIVDDSTLPAMFGVEHREHFRHMLDFEFWQHIEFFPSHRPMFKGVLEEAMGILVQMHIDTVTSVTSTSAYEDEELRAIISSIKELQALQTTESAIPYVVNASARVMSIITNERFYNFAGFHGARLSQAQSVRGNGPKPRSLLMGALSPVLFYAPEVHLTRLEKVWVDGVMKVRHWKTFQIKIERDWEGFVLYSTVLLNANVAFLGIPSVMSDNFGSTILTSPAAVVSQVSIIASLGSIITGLLLVRQLRIGAKDHDSEDYLAFMENRTHPQFGLETLAILYSLPYALLMWGMATFLGAVAIVCFYDLNGSSTLLTRVLYGSVWLFVVILILWTVLTGWERHSNGNRSSLFPKWWPRMTPFHFARRGETPQSPGAMQETELSDMLDAGSVRSRRSARSRLKGSISSTLSRSWRTRKSGVTKFRDSRAGPNSVPSSRHSLSFLENGSNP